MKRKAFTLIELIAVLVILAILALIVTPLVMNIIRKAKIAADKRSIDAYGRSVEIAIANYLLDTGTFPTDLASLTVEYSGKEVSCNIMQMKENGGIYLSECKINNKDVKDTSTDDGWYHYGTRDLTNEEYVDMYGTALKNASVEYYENNNQVISDYHNLTIDYNGKDISCDVTINYDGTVYLTNCEVNGTSVVDSTEDGFYHYGSIKYNPYNVGDVVSYNDENYYVIKNSDDKSPNITLIKGNVLTTEEVNLYGNVGTENSRVNMYHTHAKGVARDNNGYGSMMYYNNSSCDDWYYHNYNGCTSDYNLSDVKVVVDNWANDLFASNLIEARLITTDEIINNIGMEEYEYKSCSPCPVEIRQRISARWLWSPASISYWTMSPDVNEPNRIVTVIGSNGEFDNHRHMDLYDFVIRPVITIKKTALD